MPLTGDFSALTKTTTGTVVLTAANSYGGLVPAPTTISAGVLQLGDGVANNGSITGAVPDNATLTIANAGRWASTTPISGSGASTTTAPPARPDLGHVEHLHGRDHAQRRHAPVTSNSDRGPRGRARCHLQRRHAAIRRHLRSRPPAASSTSPPAAYDIDTNGLGVTLAATDRQRRHGS